MRQSALAPRRTRLRSHCPASPRRYRRRDSGSAPMRTPRLRRGGQPLGPHVRHCRSVEQSAGRRQLVARAYVVPGRRPVDARRPSGTPILASWTRSREWNVAVDDVGALDVRRGAGLAARARRAAGAGRRSPTSSRPSRSASSSPTPTASCWSGAPATRRCASAWTGSGWPPASATRRSSSAPTASAPRWRAAARPRCSATSTTWSTWRSSPARARPIWHPVTRQAARRHRPDLLAPRRRTRSWPRPWPASPGRSRRRCWTSPGRRELALLHDYLTACRRSRGAVFAVSPDLVMMQRPGPRADRPRRPGPAASPAPSRR